jgi:hypothetical protein
MLELLIPLDHGIDIKDTEQLSIKSDWLLNEMELKVINWYKLA